MKCPLCGEISEKEVTKKCGSCGSEVEKRDGKYVCPEDGELSADAVIFECSHCGSRELE